MDIKIVEETDDYIRFDIKNGSVGFANLLRRIVLGQVKSFAIDKITIYENTSQYFDEFVAHRIGLVPLATPDKYKGTEAVVFTLDVMGPKRIYSGDLKFTDPSIKPVYSNMPLFDISENSSLRMEGVAVLGNGRVHAKYQPGAASYTIDDKDEGLIHFYVETYHQTSVRSMLKRAIKEITERYKYIDENIDSVLEPEVK